MESLGVYLVLAVGTLFGITFAGVNPQAQGRGNHVIELKNTIETGKQRNEVTDRDINQYWAEFMSQKTIFESKFDELICTKPEHLRKVHSEMDKFIKKTEMAWYLKQEQLKDLYHILHHENYTDTALAKGDSETADLCAGLNDYIINVNATTHKFKIQIDIHLKIVTDLEIKMNTTPCPCVWGNWSEWSDCSTTCEAGKSHRGRVIAKAAINDGKDCEGPASEEKICNQDVCCPVDCVWNTWEDWPACPSGCPIGGGLQKKTRTRSKAIEAECNGQECDGLDYEKKSCSREQEIFELLHACKQEAIGTSKDLIACKNKGY